jgi:hypothetical protein
MSCGDEGDELAILPIAVLDLVSLLTFYSLLRVPRYLPSDLRVSSVALHTRVLQGGTELCRIEGFDRRKAVSELKVSIEAEAGLVPALTRLINSESGVELQDHQTLEDTGTNQGVIQLYAQKLKKVVVADELQIAPKEVTDSELAAFCDSIREDPPHILVLGGCSRVTNISCLVQLSTISHLDISESNLGAKGGFHLAGVIKDMGALVTLVFGGDRCVKDGRSIFPEPATLEVGMTEADFSNKGLGASGAIIISAWISHKDKGALSILDASNNRMFGKRDKTGITAWADVLKASTSITELNLAKNCINAADATILAPAISDNGALSSLNLAKNHLGSRRGEAKHSNSDPDIDDHWEWHTDMSGVVAIAEHMGALSTFTFSGDYSSQPVTMETTMTEADFSGKRLGVSGGMMVAAFLPKCQ